MKKILSSKYFKFLIPILGFLLFPINENLGTGVFLVGIIWILFSMRKVFKRKKITNKPKIEIEIKESNATDYQYYGDEDYERLRKLEKKYSRFTNRHYELIEEIKEAYSVILNLKGIDAKEMQQVIDLCFEDIELAPILKEYWTQAYPEHNLPSYPSFKRLAIIYEKRKEYDQAIEICKQAIELGYISDGSSGMRGRLARLIRKKGLEKELIENQ